MDTRQVLKQSLIIGLPVGLVCVWLYLHFLHYRGFDDIGMHTLAPVFQSLTPDRLLKAAIVFAAGAGAVFFGLFAYAANGSKNVYGDARFATERELVREGFTAPLKRGAPTYDDIVWGKLGPPGARGRNYLMTSVFPHGFLAAPTGAGKGVGFVIPNLLHFNGSIVCLDVKGENFAKTARHRASIGDRVIHFSPLEPEKSHCYNPLSEIEALSDPDRQYVELTKLANYLIADDPKLRTWLSGCRRYFVAAAMLAIERGGASLGAVKDMLDGATPAIFAEFAGEAVHPQAKGEFLNGAQAEPKRLNDYMDILRDSGLGLWGNPFVRRVTSRSDFSFAELRRIPTSIYLVCPEDDLNTITPLVRMFFQHLSGVLHRAEPGEDEPFKVLFLLDEFDKLGKMDTIVEAYKTIRSYGGRIVVITQSVSQLYDIYGREAVKGFISNAGVRAFAATGDLDAAQMISEIIGDRTHAGVSKSTNPSSGFGVLTPKSRSVKDEALRLMKVQDITSLPEDKFLIVRSPKRPVIVDKIRYYEDRYFQGVFEAQEGRPLPYPGHSAPKAVTVKVQMPPPSPAPAKPAPDGSVSGEKVLEGLVEESADLSAPPYIPPAMRRKTTPAQAQAPGGTKKRRSMKRASRPARTG